MKRVVSFLVGMLTLTIAGQVGASETEACVSEAANKTLNACANAQGTRFNVSEYGSKPKVSLHEQAQQERKIKEFKPGAPVGEVNEFRDSRQIRLAQRQKGLLVTAISQTEEVLQITQPTAPDRPIILRRLAEDYVELESLAMREKVNAEVARDKANQSGSRGEAGRQQAIVKDRETLVGNARKFAIQNYASLVAEYSGAPSPRFQNNPPAKLKDLDEVMYYLAYEHEQAGDDKSAIKVYRDLIQKEPQSKYVLNAYLAFGELFYAQAQQDPTLWVTAKGAYEKVVASPPPNNKVYGYAWYKLAYIAWNQSEFGVAIGAFKKTIEFGMNFPQLPNAPKLADGARKDMVPVYAQGNGNPLNAYALFHPLSGDTNSDEKTFKMLDDLGNAYMDTGHYDSAIVLYRDLMRRDSSGDKVCLYQSKISEATMALKSGDKPKIVAELENQRKVYEKFKSESHSEDSKQECANRTAALVVETAMLWHLEAVGPDEKHKGTMDRTSLDKAAELYGIAAKTWTADEFAKFKFPRLVPEDWPNMYKIKYNMADLLYFSAQTEQDEAKALEKWRACGPAFRKVVEENPNAKEAPEAAYASVLCYEQVYLQEHKKKDERRGSGSLPGVGKKIEKDSEEEYKAKEPTEGQKGMLSAFDAFICYVHPDKSDAKGYQKLIDVKYARARVYWELKRFEEAAAAFREFVSTFPESDKATAAAELYLECANILTFHGPKRTACVDDMVRDVPKFIETFCTSDKQKQDNADTCGTLAKVQCDIQRIRAYKTVEDADKGNPSNAVEMYERGGKSYLELWEKYGKQQLLAKQPMQCEKMDEILYNAARAFQAGRLIANSIKSRLLLMNYFPQSELAKEALYEIGGNYQAIAVYDQAADYYERYASQYRDRKNADKALSDAIVLRLGLGQEDQAITDANNFRAYFGARDTAKTAQIQFSVGAHYVDKGDYDRARLALQGAMSLIDRAPPDVQLQAHATLARALREMKSANAKGEYARVISMWDDSRGADGQFVVDQINKAYASEDDKTRARRIGKALDAVAEALFYQAEEQRLAKVETLPFPIFTGQRTKAELARYNETKITPWVEKKSAAITDVFKLYAKIPALKPAPPPRWVIASAAVAGLMWGNFVDDFKKSVDNLPKDWDAFPEAKAEYVQRLDEQAEKIRNRAAKGAIVRCLDESVKWQYSDEYSRKCENGSNDSTRVRDSTPWTSSGRPRLSRTAD